MDLVKRCGKGKPFDVASLNGLTTAEVKALVDQYLPPWQWDGVAQFVGRTKVACQNRFIALLRIAESLVLKSQRAEKMRQLQPQVPTVAPIPVLTRRVSLLQLANKNRRTDIFNSGPMATWYAATIWIRSTKLEIATLRAHLSDNGSNNEPNGARIGAMYQDALMALYQRFFSNPLPRLSFAFDSKASKMEVKLK